MNRTQDLVKLVAELGYDTYPQQLAMQNGHHLSGLINFFDDNPGALEVLGEWIEEHYPEQAEESEEE